MFDSSIPIRSSIAVGTSSQSSNHQRGTTTTTTITTTSRRRSSLAKPSLDEENQQQPHLIHNNNNTNIINSTEDNNNTKDKDKNTTVSSLSTLQKANNTDTIVTLATMHEHSIDPTTDRNNPTASGYDSDTSDVSSFSVAARREWLKNFEKQQHSNPFRQKQQQQQQRQQQHTRTTSNALPQSRDDASSTNDNSTRISRTAFQEESTKRGERSIPLAKDNPMERQKPPKMPNMNGSTSLGNRAPHIVNPKVPVPAIAKGRAGPVIVGASSPMKSQRIAQREQVKATDEGCASVAELSKWLASNPTSAKKKKHVRRGRNVILKSRQFEKDQENIIIVENNIPRGSVQNKKQWLQAAFKQSDADETSSVVSTTRYAKSEIAGGTSTHTFNRFRLEAANKTKGSFQYDAQSEIITDDAASSLSVAAKKDWLKNAFSSRGTKVDTSSMKAPSPAKAPFRKAHTEVMYSCGNATTSREDAASRAKLRFKERSARKILDSTTTIASTATATTTKPSTHIRNESQVFPSEQSDTTSSVATHESNINTLEEDFDTSRGSVENFDAVVSEVDDDSPVDFQAARAALLERGKNNGHNMQVVNKVYLRKQKYEKLGEDTRRKSNVNGLLKPTWDFADPTAGRPNNSYERHYVSDVAPKKSFEELP
ncbi:hypothetical protein IV203_000141 [Nitzschia inconspicua]|uniref:Uncharacterized protein n=1 Tax=Nitzschia inconspicua TaxID=303405 RepID=A0A9K3L5Y6_9STRA|nr:hypothetical protein IV203_000141 [Nitzschia inconspicua]